MPFGAAEDEDELAVPDEPDEQPVIVATAATPPASSALFMNQRRVRWASGGAVAVGVGVRVRVGVRVLSHAPKVGGGAAAFLKCGCERTVPGNGLPASRPSVLHQPSRKPPSALPQSFAQTDTCLVLSFVNGSPFHPAQRSLSRIPASRAIRSSSAGQT